jgi:DNA-dependent RNA polymerase auxiliary subunit epsilon
MAQKKIKRKPRRRKLAEPTQRNDIPFSKYRIEWVDIISDSGWADEKEFHKMKIASPVNEGWLFSKDKNYVKVFASYDKEEDGSYTFGDRTMIPWACVKKMIKIS